MLIAGMPQSQASSRPLLAGTAQWDVPIIDSSESGHGSADTRHQPDGTFYQGIGQGVLRLYTGADGSIAGYTWSDSASPVYYEQQARPLVIGRPGILEHTALR